MAPSSTAAAAASGQPSTARLDDATKTTMLLRQIHMANQDEIDIGKLAQEKAQNADIKRFASMMVTDHTNADQKLTDLAKRLNIDVNMAPREPVEVALSSANDEMKRNLRSMSGAQFDVAYVSPQVDMHTFVLKLVDEAQKTASNADVKKLLDETRPVVENHLEHSRTLMRGLTFSAAAVGGGPGGEGAPAGSAAPAAKHDGGTHGGMHPGSGTKSNMNPNNP